MEVYNPQVAASLPRGEDARQWSIRGTLGSVFLLQCLADKKVAWVGDTNNITNELLVTLPRLGMRMAVASPKGYDKVHDAVWSRV